MRIEMVCARVGPIGRGLFGGGGGGRGVLLGGGRGGLVGVGVAVALALGVVVRVCRGWAGTETGEAGGAARGHAAIGEVFLMVAAVKHLVARVRGGRHGSEIMLTIGHLMAVGGFGAVLVGMGVVERGGRRGGLGGGSGIDVGGAVCLEEECLVNDAVEVVGDTAGTVGGAGAAELLAPAVGAGCASLEALLANRLALLVHGEDVEVCVEVCVRVCVKVCLKVCLKVCVKVCVREYVRRRERERERCASPKASGTKKARW